MYVFSHHKISRRCTIQFFRKAFFHLFAFKWDAAEVAGAYYAVLITISNLEGQQYIFNGNENKSWNILSNWQSGTMPPNDYSGKIIINSDCEVPAEYNFQLGEGVILEIKSGVELIIKNE
jgi:hypothetical protein